MKTVSYKKTKNYVLSNVQSIASFFFKFIDQVILKAIETG